MKKIENKIVITPVYSDEYDEEQSVYKLSITPDTANYLKAIAIADNGSFASGEFGERYYLKNGVMSEFDRHEKQVLRALVLKDVIDKGEHIFEAGIPPYDNKPNTFKEEAENVFRKLAQIKHSYILNITIEENEQNEN